MKTSLRNVRWPRKPRSIDEIHPCVPQLALHHEAPMSQPHLLRVGQRGRHELAQAQREGHQRDADGHEGGVQEAPAGGRGWRGVRQCW